MHKPSYSMTILSKRSSVLNVKTPRSLQAAMYPDPESSGQCCTVNMNKEDSVWMQVVNKGVV